MAYKDILSAKNLQLLLNTMAYDLPLDNTRLFADKLQSIELDLGPKASVKKVLQLARELYPELSLIEQFAAIKQLSSEAHVATPQTDPETYKVFEEAFAAHQAHSKTKKPIPRLIITKSDFPNLSATNSCSDEQSIIASSKSIELLTRDELKGSMLHEFGHIKRDLNSPMYITAPLNIRHKLTRNATRRGMEYAADSYAIECGTSPEVLNSSLKKQYEYMNQFLERANKVSQELIGMLEETENRAMKVMAWALTKKTKGLDKMLNTGERETTWTERLCDAPAYPTLKERIDANKGKTQER